MNAHTFALYVATEAALSLTPGPAVLLVVAYGLAHGWQRSIFATLGILAANAIYFAASATGLGVLIRSSQEVFTAIQWLGAAYLAWLGLSALLGKPGALSISTAGAREASPLRIFTAGLMLQLANPKSLLFFVAILPQFVDPKLPVASQMIWLAFGSILPEFAILAGYGALAGRASRLATQQRFARWTERVSGGLIVAAAALVASVGRI